MVSFDTRCAIWREYRPGQETSKTPSDEYMVVMRQAIDEVAHKEERR